ncbi:integrin alpha-9 [Tupaia chinensis]|uniref:integrin alpha-9 n=1 Tax=Tupaia chinensis TaxID=246437 RepID=UPI000FFB1D60|nr:integrin alpha-9 [Tupaia chinensis]
MHTPPPESGSSRGRLAASRTPLRARIGDSEMRGDRTACAWENGAPQRQGAWGPQGASTRIRPPAEAELRLWVQERRVVVPVTRVLVGAPKADSKYSTSVKSPGAVFKCRVHTNPDRRCTELDMARGKNRGMSCGKTCREDRDDEWMGVSLARQPRADGRVLACAHRWKNIYYETDHILPHGFCYIIPSNLQAKGRTLIPCYEEYKKKYGEEHGSCQAGIAGFFTEVLVFTSEKAIGACWGAPAGRRPLDAFSSDGFFFSPVLGSCPPCSGYAVTAGHFSHPSTTDVVGGAPQDEGIGKVYIFKADRRSGTLIKIFQASGKKMGSYFGSSLCAVDLNGDGLSDLLVGAPMFSEIRDEGQVTVYINRGNGALEEQLALAGDGAYNAHFGESIASLGDLDDDGFPDVAIGAPKEDDFAGAVYIYHGDAGGIVPQYSMKLSGQKINPVLRMFGQSISGGIDMDGNRYPDVTIGAFMSDSVVLLRARPVITVDVSIFLPGSINITAPQCHDGQQPVNCLNVTACFSFHGKQVPGEIGLNYVLTADVAKKEKGELPRVYLVLLGETAGQVAEKLQLVYMEETCHHYVAHVKRRVQDVTSPIVFEVAYSLGEHVTGEEEKELPALTPVLRWKKGQKIAQKNQVRTIELTAHRDPRGQLSLVHLVFSEPLLVGSESGVKQELQLAELVVELSMPSQVSLEARALWRMQVADLSYVLFVTSGAVLLWRGAIEQCQGQAIGGRREPGTDSLHSYASPAAPQKYGAQVSCKKRARSS